MTKGKQRRWLVWLMNGILVSSLMVLGGLVIKFQVDKQHFLWESEIAIYAGHAGMLQAVSDFREGELRMLELIPDADQQLMESMGRTEGVFQVYAWSYTPELGRAHRVAAEMFVSAYNTRMHLMVSEPESYLEGIDPQLKQSILDKVDTEEKDSDPTDHD